MQVDSNNSGSEFVAASGAKVTLRTKAFVVNREVAFIQRFADGFYRILPIRGQL
jgi:hypothetical protein